MNLHICLVSDQLLANYIPIMMYRPDQVHLVSSTYVREKGLTARLEKMLQQQGIRVVCHEDMPDADIQKIRDYAENLWQTIDQQIPNATITLNITGGNKLMVLGMWEMLDGAVEMIYTDTRHNCIEHLHDQHKEPLRSVLDIRQYLQAQGAAYQSEKSTSRHWREAIKKRQPISEYLAFHASQLESMIGTLNYHANNALSKDGESLPNPVQSLAVLPRGLQRDLLLKLHKANLLNWDAAQELVFLDAERTRYLGGIWLEEYVYLTALDAQPEHVACSVAINWQVSHQTNNELDVLIVHNNRMLVIECKTLRLGRDEQKDADILYKIDSLGDDVRGLFGETWLVSAREPTERMLARAKDRHIRIISPDQLKGLREAIQAWMQRK